MAIILVVDDGIVKRRFLVKLLEHTGHRVLEAKDGAEGLAMVRAERPDLVISDILMPTTDGYELVRQIRADPAIAHTQVIFYTSHFDGPEMLALAHACGVITVLTNPCQPEVVLQTVAASLWLAPAPPLPRDSEQFDREHLRLLTDKLSQNVDELRRTNERQAALVELGLQLGSERDPQMLLQRFCEAAREIIGSRYAMAGILADGGKRLEHLFTSGMDAEMTNRLSVPDPTLEPRRTVLADGRTMRLHNLGGNPAAAGFSTDGPPLQAWLGVPVSSPVRVYGWLELIDKVGGDGFSEEDERLSVILAAQLGRIYENGNLYADLARQAANLEQEVAERKRSEEANAKYIERLKILHQIDRALIAGEGPAAIAAEALVPLRELLGNPALIVNLFDLATGEVEWLAAAGRRRVRVGPGIRYSIRLMGDVESLRRGELQLIDVHALPPSPEVEALLGSGVHAYVVVPMIVGGELIALSFGGASASLSPEQVSIAQEAATQFAIALAQVRLHERIKRQAQELEIRITERANNLEEQLRQAQKMEAVGKLAGGVAHDFNNLLTVINGYSEILLEQLVPGDPSGELIDQIRRAGVRAAGLTRQLLAFSRKQVLTPVVLDLNLLLLDMQKMLQRLIGEDIDLLVSPASQLWPVKADAGQIEQIVMNLAVNARDAMPQGGKLTFETDNVELDTAYQNGPAQSLPGQYTLLAISDTGCGMDQAIKSRIFEPFFTTKGPEKGTGLGLATVWGIIKQSGGLIDVYSEVGIGTVFKIYLPRTQEGADGSQSYPGFSKPVRGTDTILLVEDEEPVRALARLVLQSHGYTVLEAANGREALILSQQHAADIHLLVTDIVMPNMGGRQLADCLAAERPESKVLYISGYTDDAVVRHGVLNAKMPFLQKPFSPLAFVRKVREVLDQ